ncbi:alpha-amylase family glycosyl hydrolase [Planococcus maritimus]|uniref:alpha-amylase family glycosyl hydrolase n=1 Tax=Planococcus maritimus TaxID=192421 RepID=UPI000796F87E|nr:alpha-amylase family glycosyl hydrolase [Planococcus maritimus]KYG59180.1 alpha-amlyase [Planococcus maritimus]OED32885.1 alpha-amlyase [Planococcus maritimus]
MKKKMMIWALAAALLLPTTAGVAAEETRTIEDESIYDVLVDRYFNKQIQNDYAVDATDPAAFSGGDFAGMESELAHVRDMGFTMLSVGPVFQTASYDGRQVLDYSQLERHFGTAEEFQSLIEEVHEGEMKVIVDLPTQEVSAKHVWVQEHPEWFTENENETLSLDTSNEEAQQALIKMFADFRDTYAIDGVRLLNAEALDPVFVETFSADIKQKEEFYVLADAEMDNQAGFDAVVQAGVEQTLRDSYRNFDQSLAEVPELMQQADGKLIRVDSLDGSRFTFDIVESRGYPPTRWRMLFSQLLTMPGVPVVQYGSETAMNGEALPESHQILDMAVEKELIDHITNLNSLRNSSEALRTGDLEMLHEEEGWMVYKRSNDEESWIIAINNSSETKSLSVAPDVVGEGMELRGLFESDIVRPDEDGQYRLTLDRELVETYHITEKRGLNTAYIVTLGLMYLIFMGFLWVVWKKGKQRKADEAAKQTK